MIRHAPSRAVCSKVSAKPSTSPSSRSSESSPLTISSSTVACSAIPATSKARIESEWLARDAFWPICSARSTASGYRQGLQPVRQRHELQSSCLMQNRDQLPLALGGLTGSYLRIAIGRRSHPQPIQWFSVVMQLRDEFEAIRRAAPYALRQDQKIPAVVRILQARSECEIAATPFRLQI